MTHESAQCFPIAFAARGATVLVIEIRGGDRLRQRLSDLGLNVGMPVRVIQGDLSGPMILAIKNDTRLAVGQGMAHKIMVRYAQAEEA